MPYEVIAGVYLFILFITVYITMNVTHGYFTRSKKKITEALSNKENENVEEPEVGVAVVPTSSPKRGRGSLKAKVTNDVNNVAKTHKARVSDESLRKSLALLKLRTSIGKVSSSSLISSPESTSSVDHIEMVRSPFTPQDINRITGRGSLGIIYYSPKNRMVQKCLKDEEEKHKDNSKLGKGFQDSTKMPESRLEESNFEKLEEPVQDGRYFLEVVGKCVEELEIGADRIEKEVNICPSEEASGILRATSGKARLLIAEKINQFIGLCHNNLKQSPDEAFPTTNEDLAGFWDMVMLQVNDILKQFKQVQVLRENNWKLPDFDKRDIRKVKHLVRSKVMKPSSEVNNAINVARRNRLEEIKKTLRQNKAQSHSADIILL